MSEIKDQRPRFSTSLKGNTSRRGPLSGVRVVDFTENMAGPFGTMILGDQGADVVKVESPSGDVIRHSGSGSHAMASYFANLNRSKRSLSIDLHRPESRPVLASLFDSADVVVHSFRPSAARRLGLDVASVTKGRPHLIHASIVGFGTTGPYAERPVYDHVIQALSGMADFQRANSHDDPHMVRHGVIDKSTGYVLAQSLCAALVQRFATGLGTNLEISMLDVAVSLLWPDAMMDRTALKPELRRPAVALTFRLTPTADGFVSLIVIKQAQWDGLIAGLDMKGVTYEELGTTPSTSSMTPGEILSAARAVIATLTSEEVVRRLSENDVPCAEVLTLDQMIVHPQIIANETLVEYDHPLIGPIRQPRAVPKFTSMSDVELVPAPGLGNDSKEILIELGLNGTTIDELIASGVVVVGRTT
ncbi:MAG TPA: CoA transferase [Acidimicrobiales bacterium]|nr:CoA transferase [Acidimicrobiales bacterium]